MILTIILTALTLTVIAIVMVYKWMKSGSTILITGQKPDELAKRAFLTYIRKKEGMK